MSLERLKHAAKKTVGSKQTVKAIERGNARTAFVARDADPTVVRQVVAAAQAKQVELVYVDTMASLGKACGIDVRAAAAAILG